MYVLDRPWIAPAPVGVEPAQNQGESAIDTAIGFFLGDIPASEWAQARADICLILDPEKPSLGALGTWSNVA